MLLGLPIAQLSAIATRTLSVCSSGRKVDSAINVAIAPHDRIIEYTPQAMVCKLIEVS